MIVMMTGDLSKLDKAEKKEFISAINDAILKQKYRIVVRRIFKQYTYNDKKEVLVFSLVGFL